jgi:predicted GNAT family acetyltransferase
MTVEHRPDEHRFVVQLDGGDAELTYTRPDAKTIDLRHTGVPKSGRGHGVADALAAAAFAYARAEGLRVIPTCPFVQGWLGRHPEGRDLIDAP